ncbi:MAG: endonuclease/exonuclease/phosphatase family protein [Steroidobacteraceae bacterium]
MGIGRHGSDGGRRGGDTPVLRGSMVERYVVVGSMLTAAAALVATLLAATAAHWWIGDLAVHFRLQYAAAALVALIVLAWVRHWSWAGAALVALILDVLAAAPVLAPPHLVQRAVAGTVAREPLRIASINVLFHNTHYGRVIAFLQRARPDAAVLVEITPRWRDALAAPLRGELPYQFYAAGWPRQAGRDVDSHGTLLLSRWPIEHVVPIAMGPHADPTVVAALDIRGRTLHLIGVHPSWPIGPAVSAERNRELRRLAALARSTPAPIVMAGDFNVTPFSPYFRTFVAASGLRWAAQGAGWQPTWPTFLPPGGIQIDHAFVSPAIAVRRFARGPGIGSDHRPILVDLEW